MDFLWNTDCELTVRDTSDGLCGCFICGQKTSKTSFTQEWIYWRAQWGPGSPFLSVVVQKTLQNFWNFWISRSDPVIDKSTLIHVHSIGRFLESLIPIIMLAAARQDSNFSFFFYVHLCNQTYHQHFCSTTFRKFSHFLNLTQEKLTDITKKQVSEKKSNVMLKTVLETSNGTWYTQHEVSRHLWTSFDTSD